MRLLVKILPSLLVLIFMSFCTHRDKDKLKLAGGEGAGIKVFELFTSEGCSSCPPADALMLKLVHENRLGVFVLTYHVDYWNRLGWKDSFSDASYTDRQNLYAARFNNQSVYTPQLVVNGLKEFTGSEKELIEKELSEKNPARNRAALEVQIIKMHENNITFKYSLPATRDQFISFALVQSEATTNVKRGENNGRTLKHVNVVRSLKTFDLKENSQESEVKFDIAFERSKYFVVAFAQNKKDLEITHALKIDL